MGRQERNPVAEEAVQHQIMCMSAPTRSFFAVEAARRFTDVIKRALYRRETPVLLKNGAPVAYATPPGATGIPAGELSRRWALLPRLAPADADAFAHDVAVARAQVPTTADPRA